MSDQISSEQLEEAVKMLKANEKVDDRCIDFTIDENGQTAIFAPSDSPSWPDEVNGVKIIRR